LTCEGAGFATGIHRIARLNEGDDVLEQVVFEILPRSFAQQAAPAALARRITLLADPQ
jgi:hypothetical protein